MAGNLYLDFWTDFDQYCARQGSTLPPRSVLAEHKCDFELGFPRVVLGLNARKRDRRLLCQVYASGGKHGDVFRLLAEDQDEIERELFERGLPEAERGKIEWLPDESPNSTRIGLAREGFNIKALESWPDAFHWLMTRGEPFYHTFRPRVENLRFRMP